MGYHKRCLGLACTIVFFIIYLIQINKVIPNIWILTASVLILTRQHLLFTYNSPIFAVAIFTVLRRAVTSAGFHRSMGPWCADLRSFIHRSLCFKGLRATATA